MNSPLLVSFTILSQAAIGIVIFVCLSSFIFIRDEIQTRRSGRAFLAAAVLSALAMALSGLDLGSPFRAPNAILHITSSWLSREILLTSLFFAAAAAGFFLARKGREISAVAVVGAILGIFCVLAQAAVYSATVIPAWGFGQGYLSFVATTLIFGAFFGALFMLGGKEGMQRPGAKKYFFVCLAFAVIAILATAGYYPVFTGMLVSAGPAGEKSMRLLGGFGSLLLFRWLCAIAALLIMGAAAHKQEVCKILTLGLCFAAVGEIIGRVVFYGIGAAIGIY